jgi:uncharacterized protein YfaS (alpha-2-macroglobulin family)
VKEPAPEVKLRSDFSETVFFHPHLTTDEKGGAVIRFNAPQSLTRWKFMGLATSEDLSIGTITEEVVTRKLLMVTPNYPRFVREGDKLRFQVKVDVVDTTVSEVTASLAVQDALTGEPLKSEIRKKFQQDTGSRSLQKTKSLFSSIRVKLSVGSLILPKPSLWSCLAAMLKLPAWAWWV